jgi:hypothetical protein
MQAGKYWVGDLCYIMNDEEWDEVLELTDLEDQPWALGEGEFTFKDGRRFAMYRTIYGDGSYPDQSGCYFPVDSGSIGCVRVDDFEDRAYHTSGGAVYTFENDFETFSTKNGLICIGHVEIDTSEDEEEYCDEDAY